MEKLSFDNIKKMYPNEWIYLGDPEITDNEIVSAVLIAHHSDKKELAIQNSGKGKNFSSAVIRYTGEIVKRGKWLKFKALD
jgi:hypothetical protein